MKRLITLVILLLPLMTMAQTEYRFTGTYLGNSGTGLRRIQLDIEILNGTKWNWLHKALITTGLNLEMATVESDTNYDARSWKDLMATPEIKQMYTRYMDTYIQRIDAKDISTWNTESNKTNNLITLDRSAKTMSVHVRGVGGDNMIYIDIQSLDNQYYIMYNKPIVQYSLSLIDLSTVKLKQADYIVRVTPNKGEVFSSKISIY